METTLDRIDSDYEKQLSRKMALASAVIMASAAEGKPHYFAERLVSGYAISVDELATAVFGLQGSRLDASSTRIIPSAGAYPLTELESQLQLEVIRPAAVLIDELNGLRSHTTELLSPAFK